MLEWVRYFGAVAIVPLVGVMAAYVAVAGALVGAFARRGIRSPLLTAAAWVASRRCAAASRSAGSRGASSASRSTTSLPARALASVGGVALVTFVVVAAAGFAVDLAIALRGRDAAPRRWRRSAWSA